MVKISEKQKSIIVGTLLGDGYIYKDKYGGCRLEIKHSNSQKDYVFWLHNNLNNICPGIPKQRKDNFQWKFNTESNNDLIEIYNLFYGSGFKKIPENISDILTNVISLAVWFMDDGSIDYRPKSHYAFKINTNAFRLEECKILSETLYRNFVIVSSVNNTLCRGKRYPGVYIGKKGRDRFLELIRPHIIPCFKYKLPSHL